MINFGKFQLKFCIQMSLIMCVQMQMSETNAMQTQGGMYGCNLFVEKKTPRNCFIIDKLCFCSENNF